MATSSLIIQSYLQTIKSEKMDELRRNAMIDELLQYNKKIKGVDFLTPLNFYLALLEDTDEVMIHYMSPKKKEALRRDLQVTYLLLLAQKKYELTHQKTENRRTYEQHIKKCAYLLDALNYQIYCEEKDIDPAPEFGHSCEPYMVNYLGIFLGQFLAGKIVDMMNRTTKTIKEAMGWFNEKRLYWVWGGGLLKTVLAALPADFFNTTQATKTVRSPDLYTGALSWILYYFRFALNLSLLLKHTIKGPWMSKEEGDTPWYERFKTQWDQRKFTLLNDSIWATGNLVCFFWLTGKSVLGTWGDALTLALLVFDVTLAIWDYAEQKTRYTKEMKDFEKDMGAIQEQIDKEKAKGKAADKTILRECKIQLDALQRAKNQCQREWDYQKINLYTGIAYAIGLMAAFVLLTAPFLPITGVALFAMGMVGAVLCFAFSVLFNAVKGGIAIHKTANAVKEAKEEYKTKIELFHELLTENSDLDDDKKKFLFLEIKKLRFESEYQQKMVTFQMVHLFRSIIIESLVPALVFASFVFLPLGIGFAVLGAALALAIVSNIIINAYKPEKEQLTEFNDAEYKRFCADPDHWDKELTTGKSTLFKPSDSNEPALGENHYMDEGSPEDGLLGNERTPCSGF